MDTNRNIHNTLQIGILGGTFNPPHLAHLALACAAKKALALDKVLLVTSGDPPHKEVEVTAAVRHAMVSLAAKSCDGVNASDIELRQRGKNYTVDTLRTLGAQYPSANLHFIVGGDMLLDLASWKGAEELFQLAQIVVFPRQGTRWMDRAVAYLQEHLGAQLVVLSETVPDISSTQVRRAVRDALPTHHLLLPAVEMHLYETGIYFPQQIQCIQANLREQLEPRQYTRSMALVRAAVTLAAQQGIDGPSARLAALSHDYVDKLPLAVPRLTDDLQKLICLAKESMNIWDCPTRS